MDRIILNNGEKIEFLKIEGLAITFSDVSLDILESKFTIDNCAKIQLENEGGVYGIYNNLQCSSIIKNTIENNYTVNLIKLNDLQIQVDKLQSTVDTLVLSGLEG